MHPDAAFHLKHSSHDVEALLKRWDTLGFEKDILHHDEGFPVVGYSINLDQDTPRVYLSAGVHGDEPAPPWGLLHWAEAHLQNLARSGIGFMIFPCMNPYGVHENTRRDSTGRDLNRNFSNDTLPLIRNWKDYVVGKKFDLAMQLHEDYDGCGLYVYEVDRTNSGLADRCLSACESILPRDSRAEIDESDFENGILVRGNDEDEMRRVAEEELDGWPEAIYLFLENADRVLTFESPSEFALVDRVRCHTKFVQTAVAELTG